MLQRAPHGVLDRDHRRRGVGEWLFPSRQLRKGRSDRVHVPPRVWEGDSRRRGQDEVWQFVQALSATSWMPTLKSHLPCTPDRPG